MSEVSYKEITIKDSIKYDWLHERYGRAWFMICPVFKYGYLRNVFLTARSQERENNNWKLIIDNYLKVNQFQIESWSDKKDPHNWLNQWCKDHKTIMRMVYVPDDTDKIEFEYHFGELLTIRFD